MADELGDGTTASVTCPSYTVPAGSSIECSYTASPDDASATLNTATVTSLTAGVGGDTATADVGWTATVYNGSAEVDDDQESDFPTTVNAGAGPWQWSETQDHTCSTSPDDYGEDGSYSATLDNYAMVTGSDGQTDNAEAHTTYTCYIWDVSKTADGSYNDQYDWDITKTVDPESQSGFAGDTLEWEWTISWNSFFVGEINHAVSGVITVDNPADIELTVDMADELSGGFAATVTCNDGDGGTDLTIAANSSGICNYSAAPDSRLAQNTATATRKGFSVSDTINVNWVQGPDVGLDATISDSNNVDIPVDSAQPYQYTESVDCSTDTSLYVDEGVSYSGSADNEATITWTGGSDSSTADTDYTCYIPEISKTAEGTYDETHTWDIEKEVTPTSQTGYPGDDLSWEWKITLSETSAYSNFRVKGVITLVNPNPEDELEVTLTDTLNGNPLSTIGLYPNAATNCNLSAGAVWTLPAGATGTCNYISTVTWDTLADAPTQNDVRAHLYFGDPDRHTAVKYVASPIEWTANVINGTADVDDDQESDFPTTVNAGEGPWEWTETQSHTCSTVRSDYGEDGSYSDTRYNTATVSGSDGGYDESSAQTTYTCETSYVDVLKLTNGVLNPDMNWSFQLRQDGATLESLSTPPTLLEFQTTLVPGDEYTMCETGIPPSWTLQWALDSNGNGVIDEGETLPFVGGEADLTGDGLLQVYDPDPLYGQEGAVNDTRCVNFLADTDAGDTVSFIVDNQRPGGEPRTPGYWKNWNTCSGGNQPQTAANNGGPSEGWFLLDDLIPTSVGDLVIDSCDEGVSILDQRDLGSDRKRASDAAYTLAMHLLAAKLNLAAGAETCPAVVDAVADGDALLSSIGFDGSGQFLRPRDTEYQNALDLAGTLDAYNNGELCGP